MKAWTDYPLYPSEKGKIAPVRKVLFLHWDGNKYGFIYYKGDIFNLKISYLYSEYGRLGKVPRLVISKRLRLPEKTFEKVNYI